MIRAGLSSWSVNEHANGQLCRRAEGVHSPGAHSLQCIPLLSQMTKCTRILTKTRKQLLTKTRKQLLPCTRLPLLAAPLTWQEAYRLAARCSRQAGCFPTLRRQLCQHHRRSCTLARPLHLQYATTRRALLPWHPPARSAWTTPGHPRAGASRREQRLTLLVRHRTIARSSVAASTTLVKRAALRHSILLI